MHRGAEFGSPEQPVGDWHGGRNFIALLGGEMPFACYHYGPTTRPDPGHRSAAGCIRLELQWMLLPVQLSTQFELVAGYQTQDREDAGHTARQRH
jgi:hypothetical protein